MFGVRRILRRKAPARAAEASAPEPAPAPAQGSAEQIEDLYELRVQGILTEEEFAAEKKKLLGS